jgi:hypothetical protein
VGVDDRRNQPNIKHASTNENATVANKERYATIAVGDIDVKAYYLLDQRRYL